MVKSKTAAKPGRRTYFEVIPVAVVARLPGVARASETAGSTKTPTRRRQRKTSKPGSRTGS
jgi:hypothetical protein